MERKINRIKLFSGNDEKILEVKELLLKELLKYHFEIVDDNYDLAISIGGDGSFLNMVKENQFNNHPYYIGVNVGTLGFLQEIDIKDTINFVNKLNHNEFKIEELSLVETKIYQNDEVIKYNSLNEVVIRANDFSLLKGKVYIDQELLEDYAGDGLLVSTPTGSTAYNTSFGGPIIYNTLKTLLITPIAPISNKAYRTLSNSIVIPNDKTITFIPNDQKIFFMFDGKNKEYLKVSKIEINNSKEGICCLRMNDFHFIKTINNKILR